MVTLRIVFEKLYLYERIGYNKDVMYQSACLMVSPITVNNFAALFNCMPVGRDSPIIKLFVWLGLDTCLLLGQSGSN